MEKAFFCQSGDGLCAASGDAGSAAPACEAGGRLGVQLVGAWAPKLGCTGCWGRDAGPHAGPPWEMWGQSPCCFASGDTLVFGEQGFFGGGGRAPHKTSLSPRWQSVLGAHACSHRGAAAWLGLSGLQGTLGGGSNPGSRGGSSEGVSEPLVPSVPPPRIPKNRALPATKMAPPPSAWLRAVPSTKMAAHWRARARP